MMLTHTVNMAGSILYLQAEVIVSVPAGDILCSKQGNWKRTVS